MQLELSMSWMFFCFDLVVHSCTPLPTQFHQNVRRRPLVFRPQSLLTTVSLITIWTVGSCRGKAATLLNSRWVGELCTRQSSSLTRHARCLPPSSVLIHANAPSWSIFIITKLIRGCGWLTSHIWLPLAGRNATSGTPHRQPHPRTIQLPKAKRVDTLGVGVHMAFLINCITEWVTVSDCN